MKIAHLTSVHPRNDTRVFLKMCRSIARAGHDVTLVVADGLGDAVVEGVAIRDVGRGRGRLSRMTGSVFRVLRAAWRMDAELFHLHDPELIPAGVLLRLKGRRVVFDAHEDLPKQLLSKPYLAPAFAATLALLFKVFERVTVPMLSGVIAATPSIAEKFGRMHRVCVAVNNYPFLEELESPDGWSRKEPAVAYVGGISRIRGAREVVDAMALTAPNTRLHLAGGISDASLRRDLEDSAGWDRVQAHGHVDRAGVRELLARSIAGVVTFLPAPNHLDAQPNKMFEYMSAGIPVIASDFPVWRAIIEPARCGLCVDPSSPEAIARAIDELVGDSEAARQMGERGRAAVLERFNWKREEAVLLAFYGRLINGAA